MNRVEIPDLFDGVVHWDISNQGGQIFFGLTEMTVSGNERLIAAAYFAEVVTSNLCF